MPLATGDRLGPYEILSPLGAGGMGEVYRARDSRLGREVAVKVLPEHLAQDPAMLARFEREARAVAALSHPNILALYDIGREQGIFYVVMELLEGETLRQQLSRGSLAWRKAVDLALALAEGVAAAHAKGIFHRDLKPENIFLTSDGRVKILDFGLASVEGATAGPEGATQPGTMLGTVGYMAPEQVQGVGAGALSDIFSFGCVLYEMMAGRGPFHRSTTGETLSAILRDEPGPLASVPAELDRVVSHCLEKDQRRRFQSARDLGFALRAVGSGATSAVAAAPSQAIDSIAVLPFANLSRDPEADYLSDGITESIINHLTRLPRLQVLPRSTVFRYKGQDVDPQAAGRELGARAVLAGRVMLRGETLVVGTELIDVERRSQLWGERFNRKFADIFAIEEEIAGKIFENLRGKLSGEEVQRLARRGTEDSEAYQLYLKGRYFLNQRRPASLREAIRYFEQAIARDPDYALPHSGLSDASGLLAFFGAMPGREAYIRARPAALRAVAADPTLAEAYVSLGSCQAFEERAWREAEKSFQRALELNSGYWLAHTWYALIVLGPLGRHEEALAQVRQALELEPVHPTVHHHAAVVALFARRPDLAIEWCQNLLHIDQSFDITHLWLGLAYQQQQRYREAVPELELVCERFRDSFLPAPLSLAHLHTVMGNRAEAERIATQMDEIATRLYVEPFWRGVLHVGLGQYDRALACLERMEEDQNPSVAFLSDPRLDPVRVEPRFQQVLRRLRLA
jgi:serine/threonine protein kinase/tetratricopeptide (TPR) repeat protein